jgi:hypothetical protein
MISSQMLSPASENSRTLTALAGQRRAARDEVAALVENRLEQLAEATWREARQAAAGEFNRAARRLRRCENQEVWAAAVLDSAAPFAPRAALFLLSGSSFKALKARNLDEGVAFEGLDVPLAQAPAIASAAASGEPVVVFPTAAELSAPVSALFASAGERCAVIPITAWNRTVALLCAASSDPDANALEAIAALASSALELRGAPALKPAPAALDLCDLPRQEQELHVRARRFARVRVAEIQLRRPEAVRTGRARKNLYAELKKDIDSGRDAFHREFIARSSAMIDYFHLELVRILANHDDAVLGKSYPGPLVPAD